MKKSIEIDFSFKFSDIQSKINIFAWKKIIDLNVYKCDTYRKFGRVSSIVSRMVHYPTTIPTGVIKFPDLRNLNKLYRIKLCFA